MPVKRRRAKCRPVDPAAWAEYFEWGYSFDEPELVGMKGDPIHGEPSTLREYHERVEKFVAGGGAAGDYYTVCPPEDAAEAYRLTGEAWAALGQAYITERGVEAKRAAPWALGAFGKPWEGNRNAG